MIITMISSFLTLALAVLSSLDGVTARAIVVPRNVDGGQSSNPPPYGVNARIGTYKSYTNAYTACGLTGGNNDAQIPAKLFDSINYCGKQMVVTNGDKSGLVRVADRNSGDTIQLSPLAFADLTGGPAVGTFEGTWRIIL